MPRLLLCLTLLLGVSTSWADDERAAAERPSSGKLTGRFVYDGEPPARQPLKISTTRMTLDGKEFTDGAAVRFSELNLLDETLVVGADRGIQNILVWISDKKVPVPPVPRGRRLAEPATLTFRDGRMEPHVLAWWAEHRILLVKNEEQSALNLRWDSPTINNFNQVFGPGESAMYKVDAERRPSFLRSDMLIWLQPAVLFASANPYFVVSDAEGYFTISDVPAGEWEVRAWHERCGWVKLQNAVEGVFPKAPILKVKFDSGISDVGTIKVLPGMFEFKSNPKTVVRPEMSAVEPAHWRKHGDGRRSTNDRAAAEKWVGKWMMHLPAGFQHAVTLRQTDDGLLVLEGDKALNLLGTFAFTKDQLQLVKSPADGVDDFIWQLNDEGKFVLITDRTRVGATYIGAVLERSSK